MLTSVQRHIEQEKLLLPGETVIVGVSGGNDSIALLHILRSLNQHYQYGWKLHAVHLNHCFRGEESSQDAAYVASFCREIDVPCHLFERDVPAYMRETGLGAQEASRELRYGIYRQVAKQCGAAKVALAHHADDQVETILFRLLRGTRLNGLTGMPQRRWLVHGQVEVVRPLLSIRRRELEEYCRQNGLEPREDSSNRSRKYKRNLLRLDVMPLLETVNERYREHILALAEAVREDEEYLQKQSRAALEQVILEQKQNHIAISRDKFQTCDVALQRRMITLILSYLSRQFEWSSQHVEAVLRMMEGVHPSAVLHLPDRLVARRMYERVSFSRDGKDKETGDFCYEVAVPGSVWIAESGIAVHTSYLPHEPEWGKLPRFAAVFDADRLSGSLRVRNRKPGDRLALFGSGSVKKLKELLIDAKIPKACRERLPVFVAGEEVIWVPGVRRSAAAPVDEQTTRFLCIEVEFGEDWREVFLP
ncbi:tRNA lysidine(34) synthetase TilS [Brevibacillus sp. H7]|uniref:tRNA lysidine(34) synthetase TilS n=1 Tax=Brevibacillus sp. H7 TaxID=3349138 RepID=UPI00381B096C